MFDEDKLQISQNKDIPAKQINIIWQGIYLQ